MYIPLKIVVAGFLVLLLYTGCKDGFKSYGNDNTARPTVPDMNDRNIGDDGTSDKLIDPFYKKAKKWNKNKHSLADVKQLQ